MERSPKTCDFGGENKEYVLVARASWDTYKV